MDQSSQSLDENVVVGATSSESFRIYVKMIQSEAVALWDSFDNWEQFEDKSRRL